jgi:hypothetical protein
MPYGMLRHAALVRTDVSKELIAFIIRVERIGELATANVVPNSRILVTLMKEAIRSSKTSAFTRARRRHSSHAVPGY